MQPEGKPLAVGAASEIRERALAARARRRIEVLSLRPEVDGGRYAAKAIAGDTFSIEADLVADGHDLVAGVARYRRDGDSHWREAPLARVGHAALDRWGVEVILDEPGLWHYTVEGWIDHFATWRRIFSIKVEAGQHVDVELIVGADLVEAAAARAAATPRSDTTGPGRGERARDGERLMQLARAMRGGTLHDRIDAALDDDLPALMTRWPDRSHATRHPERDVVVDRERARFSAWYEFFPRSFGRPGEHGTFRDAERHLDYIARLGFDVVYLPPIHPIGRTHRKGRNNTLEAQPDDPGSPWAIGATEGGHTAIHPELGTLEDFRRFVARARELGLEIALDIAFQASPDHPWVREHPEWFIQRPDGTIQYAENPPKKYQDIYPINFDSDDWRGLWAELLGVFTHWMDQGVKIFRVDNPHTKSLRFWEWCIAELKRRDPEVLLLAEAFTRPRLMYALAKLGFSQSYTYFTWRHHKHELIEYLSELTRPEVAAFFRPNFWPNTPDILPEDLQHGGRPAFIGRLTLAATLSGNYGVYGPAYELQDHVPRPGAEEYIDNEKYQLKRWDLGRPDSLRHFMARLNRIRRTHRALHDTGGLRFHHTDNDRILLYSKRSPDGADTILVAVNLDWHHRQGSRVWLDLWQLGLAWDATYHLTDLIDGSRYTWHGPEGYVELDPYVMPVHIFRLQSGE